MTRIRLSTLCLILAAICLGAAVDACAGTIERVSVSSAGGQANWSSYETAISADGRYVAFSSSASNLVAGDTNGEPDIFVRDRETGTTERVSVSTAGAQANGYCGSPAISAGGRFVAFQSAAPSLVPDDTNRCDDVFVRDRRTGVTERVSVGDVGQQGNGNSAGAAVSADGRYVAFVSRATNLVPGDTNGRLDVFVRDRQAGTTARVSVGWLGQQANVDSTSPSLSADGRFVAFESEAYNLVFGDTNRARDVFVWDQQSATIERVSLDSTGGQANGSSGQASISADGQFVTFVSSASNLVAGDTNASVDVFVRDRQWGITERVSVSSEGAGGNADSADEAAISADGRYVAFASKASNLVIGDANRCDDVFLRDRQRGTTDRLSLNSADEEGSDYSRYPALSADGQYVAFGSRASNLVPGDTNLDEDIFVTTATFPVLLSSGSVIPSAGTANGRFIWRITYWNEDNLPPSSVWVAVALPGQPPVWRRMQAEDPVDLNYMDSAGFVYTASLPVGRYRFRFAANIGDQWIYWPLPAGSYVAGPAVVSPLALTSGYVTPASGAGATRFTWRIKYWNTDNLAPDGVWCAIWFPTLKKTYWYAMYPYDPADTNYADGKWYTYSRKWLPPGAYSYRFAARQGTTWTYWPAPAGNYASGPAVSP